VADTYPATLTEPWLKAVKWMNFFLRERETF